MTWVEALVTFAVSWWLFLFMVLPWGVRAQEDGVAGTDPGAPAKPRLLLKFAITTLLALALTAAGDQVVRSGWITLRPAPVAPAR